MQSLPDDIIIMVKQLLPLVILMLSVTYMFLWLGYLGSLTLLPPTDENSKVLLQE
jgi:hypothetical protein